MTKALTKTVCFALCFIFMFFFSSCSAKSKVVTQADFAMGSVVSVKLYGKSEKLLKQLNTASVIKVLDSSISKTIDTSDISKINSANGERVEVDSDIYNYLKTTTDIYSLSNGKAALNSGALTELWGFDTDNFNLPSQGEIDAAKSFCGDDKIVLDEQKNTATVYSVAIPSGCKLNLGSVGKGIACDQAIEYIKRSGTEGSGTESFVSGAVVSVGGSIATYGKPDGSDKWSVGIRNPFGTENEYFAVLSLGEAFISTSGDYEKTFTGSDGKKYFHILDLTTGYPAESDLTSVTVVAPTGLLSDALSTMCFILGKDESLPILNKYGAEAIFVYKDKTVFATGGIKESLKISADGFTLV